MESRIATGATPLVWAVLKRWQEMGGHVVVLGDPLVSFCLRISAADPGPLRQFRAVLAA